MIPNVPAWLAALGIKEGEYFIDSKLRARRAMKSACFSGPARIHIYLGLATMGFHQELAVRLEAGKQVPVQPADVCAATGLSRKHFREWMNCLEAHGLAKCEGWTKGRVKLYAYAVPRDVDPRKIVPRAGTIFDGCPPDLASSLNHFRIRFSDGFVPDAGTIEELERLARVAKEAESSLRAYANGLRARNAYKEERKERNIERKEAGRQADVKVESGLPACPPSVPQNNQETPQTTRGDQILQLPAVQKLQHKLSDTIGPKLLQEIVTQLGAAPLEDLNKRVGLKMEGTKSLARLPSIASDVRKFHESKAVNQDAEPKVLAEQQARFIAETKAGWDRIPESDRQLLCEVYPEVDWG
jgi:hypothetical protein